RVHSHDDRGVGRLLSQPAAGKPAWGVRVTAESGGCQPRRVGTTARGSARPLHRGGGAAAAALGRVSAHSVPVRILAGAAGPVARPAGVLPCGRRVALTQAGTMSHDATGPAADWTSAL